MRIITNFTNHLGLFAARRARSRGATRWRLASYEVAGNVFVKLMRPASHFPPPLNHKCAAPAHCDSGENSQSPRIDVFRPGNRGHRLPMPGDALPASSGDHRPLWEGYGTLCEDYGTSWEDYGTSWEGYETKFLSNETT